MVDGKLIRYLIVGVSSNAMLYLLFICLTREGVEPKLSSVIIFIISILLTFLINKKWTFKSRSQSRILFIKYLVIYLCALLLNWIILYYFVDLLKISHELVQACAIVFVAGVIFLAQRYWIFVK